jgi:hypothetical protein
MAAERYNFIIEQGVNFDYSLVFYTGNSEEDEPFNLTGYTAKMQVRSTAESADLIIELSTTNGRIVLGGTAGTIDLLIDADDTEDLEFGENPALYDLIITSGAGVVTRLLQGSVEYSRRVTV